MLISETADKPAFLQANSGDATMRTEISFRNEGIVGGNTAQRSNKTKSPYSRHKPSEHTRQLLALHQSWQQRGHEEYRDNTQNQKAVPPETLSLFIPRSLVVAFSHCR